MKQNFIVYIHETGEQFDSLTKCAYALGISAGTLSRNLRGFGNHFGGFLTFEINAKLPFTIPELSERARAQRYKKCYGITIEEYDTMVYKQGGKCAICGRVVDDKRLAVDHDHLSGEVRGALCDWYNRNLGWYEQHRKNIKRYLHANLSI